MIRIVVLLGALALALPAHAQGPGVCYAVDARAGTPFTAEGRVAAIVRGEGYTLEKGEERIEVHGIGPMHFWAEEGVPRPQIGDEIRVEGFRIDCGAGEEHLAVTVITGEQTVQLRDVSTGLPRWTKGPRRAR